MADPQNGSAPGTGVVILGTPRSGTTLLRRILGAHPRLFAPGETGLFSACGRFLRSEHTVSGHEIGVLAGLSQAGLERADVVRRVRRFALGLLDELAVRAGKPRWVEKTAFDVFYLAEIEALLEDRVRYICVVRHGLDVACSLQELSDKNGTYLPELHEYVRRYPMPLEAFVHCWVDLTRALLDFVDRHRDHAIQVRYEDLVSRPEETLRQVLAFLGEAPLAQPAARLATPDNPGIGDWKTYRSDTVHAGSVGRRRSIPSVTRARLAQLAGPLLERLGYPADPPAEEGDDRADADRRQALAMMVEALGGQGRGRPED